MVSARSKVYDYVETRVRSVLDSPERNQWRRRIWRNLNFLGGIQHFAQDPTTGIVRRVDGPTRQTFTANLILPYVYRALSRITATKSGFESAPNSDAMVDREAAKIAEKVFQSVRDSAKFEARKRRASLWAAASGLGILKVDWNPDAGARDRIYFMSPEKLVSKGFVPGMKIPDVELSPEEKSRLDAEGEYEDVAPGDVCFDVVNPMSFGWDRGATDGGLDDTEWVFEHARIPIEDLVDMYGSRARALSPDDGRNDDRVYEASIALLYGGQAALGIAAGTNQDKPDRASVTSWIEKPLRRNKFKGRRVVLAGDTVLDHGDSEHAKAGIDFPYVRFGWLPRAGSFVDIDLVGQLTDPQRGYNKTQQRLQEVEDTNGYPALVLSKNSGVKVGRLPNYPGLVYHVDSTTSTPPAQIPPAPMPNYIIQNGMTRKEEMREIASQSEASQGGAPGQVRGSGGIKALLEADSAILNDVAAGHIDSIAECGTLVLKLYGRFATEARLLQVKGAGSIWDVRSFTGANLRSHYNVRVVGRPGVDDQQRTTSTVLELVQAGFFSPQDPRHRRMVFDSLLLNSPDKALEDELVDQINAERAVGQLLALDAAIRDAGGMPNSMPAEFPVARDFDDHQVWIEVLNRFRKGPDYRSMTPDGQRMVDALVLQHTQFVMAQLQAQIAMQQGPGGGGQPAEKGTPSPPKVTRSPDQ